MHKILVIGSPLEALIDGRSDTMTLSLRLTTRYEIGKYGKSLAL